MFLIKVFHFDTESFHHEVHALAQSYWRRIGWIYSTGLEGCGIALTGAGIGDLIEKALEGEVNYSFKKKTQASKKTIQRFGGWCGEIYTVKSPPPTDRRFEQNSQTFGPLGGWTFKIFPYRGFSI